ncbi:hypothetical protein ACRRTK_024216 [Alexandromys fortis]
MSGILKRKFEDVDASSPCSSARESDDEVSSSESADSGDSVNPSTSNHFPREYPCTGTASGAASRFCRGGGAAGAGEEILCSIGHFHLYLYG